MSDEPYIDEDRIRLIRAAAKAAKNASTPEAGAHAHDEVFSMDAARKQNSRAKVIKTAQTAMKTAASPEEAARRHREAINMGMAAEERGLRP